MIRISERMVGSDERARSILAAERLGDLMLALDDPPAVALLRGLRRRGELERPPPVDTQRLLRRACGRGRPADARAPPHEPLPASAWDALLDNLARSLAVDRGSEVQADLALDNLDASGLARRRDWVRAAILRGEQTTSIVGRAPTDVFAGLLATGGDGWDPPEHDDLPAGHHIGRFTRLQRLGDGAMGRSTPPTTPSSTGGSRSRSSTPAPAGARPGPRPACSARPRRWHSSTHVGARPEDARRATRPAAETPATPARISEVLPSATTAPVSRT